MIKKKARQWLAVAVLLIITVTMQTWYLHAARKRMMGELEKSAYAYGQMVCTAYQLSLHHYAYLTDILKQGVYLDEETFLSDFEKYSEWIVKRQSAVKLICLAKDGRITHRYPQETVQPILNKNMLQDFQWSQETADMLEKNGALLVGPVELADGDVGIISFHSIYVTNEDGSEELWGVAGVLLDWAKFKNELQGELAKLEEYNVAIYKENYQKNEIADQGYILSYGNVTQRRVDIPFTFENVNMHLVVDRKDHWNLNDELFRDAVAVYAIGIIAWLLVIVVNSYLNKSRQLDVERRAGEAKTSFLSNMSHDMRTPLNGILGLLAISDENPENIQLLKENRRKEKIAAKHLLALMNNILDMSKVASGRIELENVPFDLVKVTGECREMVEEQAKLVGLTTEFEMADVENYQVIGSPLHLKEILINLYSNAIKYNKENGSVHVCIRELEGTKENAVFAFIVTDTGIGMDEKFVKTRLFKPYVQGRKALHTSDIGTGLGMPIVRQLVTEMGGIMEISTDIDKGTSVKVTLPFKKNENQKQTQAEPEMEPNISGMHILLADDVDLNLDIETYILEDSGAKVTTAVNGKEALDIYLTNEPYTFDVIVMDIIMPVMNGYEAVKQIRSSNREDAKTIPIIAMTANAFREDIEKCVRAGMNDHIAKPIDNEDMFSKIAKYKHKE